MWTLCTAFREFASATCVPCSMHFLGIRVRGRRVEMGGLGWSAAQKNRGRESSVPSVCHPCAKCLPSSMHFLGKQVLHEGCPTTPARPFRTAPEASAQTLPGRDQKVRVSMEIPWKLGLEFPRILWKFQPGFEWKLDATGEGRNTCRGSQLLPNLTN